MVQNTLPDLPLAMCRDDAAGNRSHCISWGWASITLGRVMGLFFLTFPSRSDDGEKKPVEE
jgi:hypothetical protein